MPRTLFAYVEPDRAPTLPALQAALKRTGIRLSVDEAYAPGETAGYLPCTLDGEDAGVDLRFEPDAPLPQPAAALAAERGPRTLLMKLRWSGDVREHISALALAAALAEGSEALVLDPDSGQTQTAAALTSRARSLLDDAL